MFYLKKTQIGRYIFFIVTISMLLSSCTNIFLQKNEKGFSHIPHSDYFLEVYEADDQNKSKQPLSTYMLWVERFYFGWVLYERGWLQTSEQVLSTITDSSEKNLIGAKLDLLGKRVGSEWAKDNSQRMISTKSLSNLGESLQEASSRGSVPLFLEQVFADLNMIESGDMEEDAILIERYFPDLAVDEGWDSFF